MITVNINEQGLRWLKTDKDGKLYYKIKTIMGVVHGTGFPTPEEAKKHLVKNLEIINKSMLTDG